MRILVVDDHALVRDGVASLLAAWGHEVVGQAADGAIAEALADDLQPDLILMDVRMPVMSGLEATRRILASHPDLPIVMLTVSEDEDDLFDAIQAGARGYLLKSLEGAQLRAMVDAIGRGEAAIAPATAFRIIRLFSGQRPATDEPDAATTLTARERDVLALVTDGLRNKEIAARLGITENTVKFHLRNILEKLHAVSRTELAGRAAREQRVQRD